MLYYTFNKYCKKRGILNLDVQTGSGSDQFLKTGCGSGQNTRIRNPDIQSRHPFLQHRAPAVYS